MELIEKLFPLNGWEKAVGRHVRITFPLRHQSRSLSDPFLRNHVDVDLDYGVTVSNDRCHDRGAPDFAQHPAQTGRFSFYERKDR